MKQEKLINEDIKDQALILIDETGKNLGQYSLQDALNLAADRDLDLVQLVPSHDKKLSICKLADYGKMLYEEKTKQRQARKNQVVTKVKEIKVRPQIADNDLKWMAKNAVNWLNNNDQVKFKIKAFGRIGTKTDVIEETFNKFLNMLGPVAKVQTPLKKVTPVLYEATIVKNR